MQHSCPQSLRALMRDDQGFIVSIELVLIATISIIGLIAGLTSVRDSVVSELADVAGSVQDMNQCYSYNGVVGHSATTCGSDYIDATDHCDSPDDIASAADNCIAFDVAPANEGGGEGEGGEGGGDEGDGGGIGGGVIISPPVIVRPPILIPIR